MKLATALVLVVSALLVGASGAAAAPAVNVTFPVKGVDTNSKIAAGPDGNMWVTLAGAENNVARITPAGMVTEFELGLANASGIAVGPEGRLWVTATNEVASFNASDPKNTVTKTTIVTIAGVSPIVLGPDNNLWVASMNIVLRIPPAAPNTATPFPVGELAPKDIDVAGSLLAIADGGGKNRLVTMTTAGVEKDIPIAGASQGLAGGPAGQIAFSAPGANPEQVGLVTPPNPAQESELLGDPFGVAFGADQAYWIVRFMTGELTRMTTTGAKTPLTGLPKESARQIAAGPGNTLWVTLDKNEAEGVARISGLEPPSSTTTPPGTTKPPPPATKPETKIGKGPSGNVKTTKAKAAVTFRFTSSVTGSRFECALTKARKGKKAAKPAFKSCKSPQTYSLKPGRYRFKVRAVANGLADGTPATRAFSVIHVDKR